MTQVRRESVMSIIGTSGNDTLNGGAPDNLIYGYAGA